MSDHEHVTVRAWLEAYHDGELGPRDRERVDSHLADCTLCRTELDAIESLSSLLHAMPEAVAELPADRFVAQVGLRLAQCREYSPARRTLAIGWRTVPVALVAAYLVIQVASWLTAGILTLATLDVGKEAFAGFIPAPAEPNATMEGMLMSLGLGYLGDLVRLLADLPLVGSLSALNLALTLLIGLGLWSWLALWRVRQRQGLGTGE